MQCGEFLQPVMKHRCPPTVYHNFAPIIRLWSAVIRSLSWKRIAPIQEEDFSPLPIYADVRDELASLTDSTDIPTEMLSHRFLDAVRHSVGLFASFFLRCPSGLGPDVGEVVYFNYAQGNNISSLVSLGKADGIDHLIHSNDVMESCDGEWEDYERIEQPDGAIR